MHHTGDIRLTEGVPKTPRQVSATKFLLRSKETKRARLQRDLAAVEIEIREIEGRLDQAVAS